jgi:hypothetical protein
MSHHTSNSTKEVTAKASTLEATRPIARHVTTGVHPVVFEVGLGGAVWFIAVSWLYFAWGRHVDLALAVATGFFIMFFTLFLIMAAGIIKDPRWLQHRVNFRKFLRSDVPTYTATMRGRDALIEITLIPVALAFAATIIGLAWLYLQ